MFTRFFLDLKSAGVPVSLREYLTLLEAMSRDLAAMQVERFYYLARATLVKDERHIDRFDRVFGATFEGIETLAGAVDAPEARELPEEWLRGLTEKFLTEEEKAEIEALGGWDELMKTLEERLREQEGRHQGGNKWIGTGGTSPFGHSGYNPEGVRIGGKSRHRRAVKVWEKREFRNLQDDVELGTRNIKIALRKLRRFAREGVPEEFDLGGTIDRTARSGFLDVQMRPERRNTLKVLLFFDVGGSMDPYIRICEELFSAARAEFKNMEYYYFHNFHYEFMWKNNARRWTERHDTDEILRSYGEDYVCIFVGDASMSPYEIGMPGGAVEFMNREAGAVWMQRFTDRFRKVAWLNPVREDRWHYTPSIGMVRELTEDRMYPLTLGGLDRAITDLKS